jgi:hypothetical protein
MENIESNQQVENLLSINSEIKKYLTETSRWAKFLAIIGYIGMGLLVLLGIGLMVGGSIFNSISEIDLPMGVIGIVYILLGVLYFFPLKYLYSFSTQMKQGLSSDNQQSVTSGFENLKSLYKFMGILAIVLLSIYALVLVIVIPIALFMS